MKRDAKAAAPPSAAQPSGQWGVSRSSIFDQSLADNLRVFPDLADKLAKFVAVKADNPVAAKYGKHDRPLTGGLVGLWHCHLRDDAILIYRLRNRCLHLVYIATHAEVEGKRLKMTKTRLKSVGELPEGRIGLAEAIIRACGYRP